MDTKNNTPNRRAVLGKLGLVAGAAYMAPVMLNLAQARASSGSAPSRASSSSFSGPSRPSGSGSSSYSRPSRPSASGNNRRPSNLPIWLRRFFGG